MGLGSLATWCARRRWLVLLVWIAALVIVGVLGVTVGGKYAEVREIPPGQGRDAYELLQQRFPEAKGDNADIVFTDPQGVNNPAVKERVEQLIADVQQVPSVFIVQDPYAPDSGQISADGTIAFARVQFRDSAVNIPARDAVKVVDLVEAANGDGLTVAVTGPAVQNAVQPKPPASEAFGLLAAIIILLIAFGSVVAMGTPIITALFGLGVGLSGLTLIAGFMDVPNFAPQLAAMIGLGVGIDYALFIVTRYKQELERGHEPLAAIRVSLGTAGRAVVFAGCTVMISMLGLFLMGVSFLYGLAIGSIFAVLMVMLASVTLLPAILGFAGYAIDRWKIPGLGRHSADKVTVWYRWSRQVQRRPVITAIVGLVVLLALAYPALSIRLGFSDNGSVAKGQTTRTAYDLLAKGFGPGYNGPLIVVTATEGPEDIAKLEQVRTRIQDTPGVASVGPVFPSPQGGAALIVVTPETSPQDARTAELVRNLRNDVLPDATQGTDLQPKVGGFTAIGIDFSDFLSARLPLFIGVVLALSFLLLLVVFRSILVPIKAVIMNALSIAAAYGVVVAVFQWGWLGSIIGIDRTGPIEVFVPMLLFAILFGLSMDYEVFLLSRVREEYDRTGDNREAVADGLASTARVITAAAAIMIAVFLAFVFDSNRVIKLFGLGLASAIFIDATIVRLVLVPATMELLGNANWWFPKWLDRIVPHVHIEQADIGDLDTEEAIEREYAAETAAQQTSD